MPEAGNRMQSVKLLDTLQGESIREFMLFGMFRGLLPPIIYKPHR